MSKIAITPLSPELIHRANYNSFGGSRGDHSKHDYEVYCNRVLEWPISEEKKQKVLDKIYEKYTAILSHEASHVSVMVAGRPDITPKSSTTATRFSILHQSLWNGSRGLRNR